MQVLLPLFATASLLHMAGVPLAVVVLVIAALGLIWGGNLVVIGASGIARRLGATEFAVAATVVAVGTSLPELFVSVVAIREGSPDIAVGNVFGSNIFNIATVFLADVFFTEGPILAHISSVHVITGLLVILIGLVFILGTNYQRLFVGLRRLPLSITIVVLWLFGWLLVFMFGEGPLQP